MSSGQADAKLKRTLQAAANGDGEAWRLLVTSYTPRVFGLLVKQCRDRELAEELTQATFVQLVTHLDRYDEQGRFEPWLFRIAMNKLRDEMRRRGRQARTMSAVESSDDEAAPSLAQMASADDGGPLEQMTHAERLEQLRLAVEKLPEDDREVLYMRHTAGMSFAQIAEAMDKPLGTVLSRMHRALGKLRKVMEQMEQAT